MARLSFEAIYAEHFRFVWSSVRALGVPSTMLEDAAQDVFVVVHRRLPEFQGEQHLRTWLFAIARRVAADYRRRRRSFEELSAEEPIFDNRPSPHDVTARNEAVHLLERALEEMDEHHREVFVLMDVTELRANEVAELLSINVNTVYSRLNRARTASTKSWRGSFARPAEFDV
ncbi:RNA polymerase sigma factor [Labilithrix luteola]|uniref:RNA polymerase sigma factor n=1 Tax=Labilithrix luteola TaxID=1391654 RepID=UPI001475766B|nr:sigma-70 family RNA polymerase sigma factor [Labilithrix luteola]